MMMIDVRGWLGLIVRLFVYGWIFFIITLGLFFTFICWYYWFIARHRREKKREIQAQLQTRTLSFHTLTLHISENGLITLHVQLSPLEKQTIELAQLNVRRQKILSCEMQDQTLELLLTSNIRLTIKHEHIEQQSTQTKRTYFVHEYIFIWSSQTSRTTFFDRFNLVDTGFWYGGATQKTVLWPINRFVTKRQAMIPNDAFKNMFGNVCERYWLSSMGLALLVDPLAPLFVGMDKKYLELISEFRSPYRQEKFVFNQHRFEYRLLQHVNMRDLHLTMINRHLGKPTNIPDHRMIIEPIWSTWAQFKQKIDTEKVLNYAQEIVQRNFPRSQICIDDDWTSHYGTYDFDPIKFPDPKVLISKLQELNFRVTLWIHPFISCKSLRFFDYWRRGLLINMNIFSSLIHLITERIHFLQYILDDLQKNEQFQRLQSIVQFIYYRLLPSLPGLSLWWNGLAGSLDLTNDLARQEYISNLKRLQHLYGIDSFKFDAGETNWLPLFGTFANPSCQPLAIHQSTTVTSPALYPYLYAHLAHSIDANNRLLEVRVGYRTQTLPIFVRIIDKDSNWSHNNGLRSLLPSIFNLSLLGYPFILPDMVGGNGYGLTITQTCLPQRELYIRWIQLNILLPAIQFSFPPWLYHDEQVVRIAHYCLQIRERFRSILLSTAEECVKSGAPMIRPLWFLDPYDINAQTCDTEYMLGNDLLVAPVLDEGVIEHKIYLPQGQWKSIQTEEIFDGYQMYTYKVSIEDIPIFERC